jgi:hypothetical protein
MDYKFGKPKEHVQIDQHVQMELNVADADRIIGEYLKFAAARADSAGASDIGQAAQQVLDILPS